MSRIKSAVELAMERTNDIKGDADKLVEHERKQEGKRLMADFFQAATESSLHNGQPETPEKTKDPYADPRQKLSDQLKKYSGKERQWVREGIQEVLMSRLTLPSDSNALQRLEPTKQAALVLAKKTSTVETYFQQLYQLCSQYLEDKQHMIEQLRRQFASRMRQKEQAYAQQTGQQVSLDPAEDPEFQQYLQQAQDQLQSHYSAALNELRDALAKLLQ